MKVIAAITNLTVTRAKVFDAFDALLRLSLHLYICCTFFVYFLIFCTFVLLHLSTLYTGGPRTRRPSQGAPFSDVLTLFDIQHFSDVPTRQCLCHVIYVPGCHEIMVKLFLRCIQS